MQAVIVAPRDDDPRAALWRGAQYFRALAVAYAVARHAVDPVQYDRPVFSWLLLAAVIVVSAAAALAYLRGFGRNVWFVTAEFLVSALLVLATWLVAAPAVTSVNQSLPTTLWLTNPVISAAVLAGPVAGVLGGIAVAAVNAIYRDAFPATTISDHLYPVFMSVGLGVGVAARVATRSQEQVRAAEQVAAEARARERLAREVHDGVLQALAYLSRRYLELSSATPELAELGRIAAEQEHALRRLIAETPDTIAEAGSHAPGGLIDLRELLRSETSAATVAVTLAEPGSPVRLPSNVAAEVAAAVRNALTNTAAHAGADARAYLLLEELDGDVLVTVRDDGTGIAPGRLESARAEGRLGVAESIIGRMAALGGRAELTTDVGEGVEWELWIPQKRSAAPAT